MPANLPPQYFEAEKRYRLSKTPQEKIAALEEMLRVMPKHKGTEKLQGELRRKISKLRHEAQSRSTGAKRTEVYSVEKAGAGQVALAGGPNVGKSMLIRSLTNARPEVADYPFTTRLPTTGMMRFENVQIQLVDLPPLQPEMTEGWVYALLRNADLLWLIVDLGRDELLDELDQLMEELKGANILPVGLGDSPGGDDVPLLPKKAMVVANKLDLEGAPDRLEVLKELYGERMEVLGVSALSSIGLDELKKATFKGLGKMRVYTKAPGREPDLTEPVILPIGSTVLDFAEQIHKDFAQKLKFARIWGPNKHGGQRVQRDYPLTDGDILELHI